MFKGWMKSNKEQSPQIDVITRWDVVDDEFYAPGALICVKNGKGLIYEKFSEQPAEAVFCTLMFQEEPLFQFQGHEYWCPTCEKIIRSGYRLEQTEEFHVEKLNQENISFFDALDEIFPLIGLLKDGYYVILDTQLYPTDGNGHLFWNVPNSVEPMPGSCLYYRGDGEWGALQTTFHYCNTICK